MSNRQVDILIVGGGLIGATLLLALRNLGFSTLLVESKPFTDRINADFDARSLALSPASQRILNMLGLWDILKAYATPIELIHVSEQHRFGASRLQGTKEEPLGYVLEMQHINQAIHQLLIKESVLAPATVTAIDMDKVTATLTTATETLTIQARLVVAADGAESTMRSLCGLTANTKHYNQQAIIANIGLSKPHLQKAYERFTPQGPLALLPMSNKRMSLVWAMTPEKAQALMSSNDAEFLQQVQQAFGSRLGRFIKLGQRHTYPLKQVLMQQQNKGPLVFLGNAAHTLHPVAGQGFNLGLRDAATLAQCINTFGLDAPMLEHYIALRKHDQQVITGFTDALIRIFGTNIPGMGLIRSAGLVALDNLPLLKNILARYAQGFGGLASDLICSIALSPRSSDETQF